MQKVQVIGYLGRDPEVRYSQQGTAIAQFSVATTERWKDKSGELQEHTEWFAVKAFGRLAEVIGEYLHKGARVYLEGRKRTESWDDKQTGGKHYRDLVYADKVEFLDFRDSQIGIGNPIAALQDTWGSTAPKAVRSSRKLDIRQSEFPAGIQIWGSNPAFMWTANRAEEEGIHVHAFTRPNEEAPDRDETYGEVVVDGIPLDAMTVRLLMAQSVMPSLKSRIRPLDCPKCDTAICATGAAAYSPTSEQKCSHCGQEFPTPGRIRKIVANPLIGMLAQLAKNAPRTPREHDLQLLPETL